MRLLAPAPLCAIACAMGLGACALPATEPIQVTRFIEAAASERLGNGTIFIETAPGDDVDPQDLLPYKAAIARELVALGYRETSREQAGQVAQVRISQDVIGTGSGRSPVSVGVGGSTGSYGTGAGVGIGINLGGSGRREELSTRLEVRIRDAATDQSLWEGRALFDVSSKSLLADASQNASVMAEALFRTFPGNNGETIAVPVE